MGKRKYAATFVFGLAVVILVTVMPARTTRGQEAGTAHMAKAKVTQGDNIFMDVALDKAPNRDGVIYVRVVPDGTPGGAIDLNCGLGASQTKCEASARMPLDAKLGKWIISQITFTPVSGEPKRLMEHGDSSFEVVAHGDIVLPDSATISDIK
jgi:hypothetical protein